MLIMILAAAAILFSILGCRALIRKRWRKSMTRFSAAALFFVLAILTGAVASNLYTYQRFTQEIPIASIRFKEKSPQHYQATLKIIGTQQSQHYLMLGDEWQLDARVLKWKNIATWLGLKPVFRLERLTGRYQSIQQERQAQHSVFALSKNPGIDIWQIAQRHDNWLPFVDAIYGNAVYLPMADNRQYIIYLNNSGLVARQPK